MNFYYLPFHKIRSKVFATLPAGTADSKSTKVIKIQEAGNEPPCAPLSVYQFKWLKRRRTQGKESYLSTTIEYERLNKYQALLEKT